MTPEVTKAIQEALDARELIKVSVNLRTVQMIRVTCRSDRRTYTFTGRSGNR